MKLSDIVDRINGNVDRFTTDLEYYIGGEHMKSNELEITGRGMLKENLGKLGFKFHFAFQERDVIFMARNPHLRKAGMVMFAGLCSDASYILRSKDENVITQEFLAVQLQSDHFWDYCERTKVGSVNFANNWTSIANYEFDLPPIKEQKEISQKVWAAYRLKGSYKKLLAATDEMVKSQFIEMFGDKQWKEVHLEDVVSEDCSLSYGIVQPGEGVNEGIPVVRPVDLINNIVEPDNLKRTTTEIANAYKRTTLRGGELLLCVRGTTGLLAMASNNLNGGNVTRGIVPIWFRQNVSKSFMFYLMKSDYVQKQIKDKTYGTTLLQINIKDLRQIKVILPPDTLQQEFIAIAEQADKSKFELRKSIDAIDAVIKSLINN